MQRSTNKIQRGDTVRSRRMSRKQRIRRARRRRRILIAVLALLILAPAAAGLLVYQFHPVFLKSGVVAQELKETFQPEKNIRIYQIGTTPV